MACEGDGPLSPKRSITIFMTKSDLTGTICI